MKRMYIVKSDEVHIWAACLLENENDVAYFSSILSADERERARNFRFSRDQKQFIVTRGILRSLLAMYLGKDPRTIEIVYGLWGKPCLSKENSLRFNVSHSSDYALYALAHDYEVGIDLEYIDKNLELDEMALTTFSPFELSYWQNTKSEDKVHTFFKLWVCKEALLKASGKGWLKDQKEISFEISHLLRKGLINDFWREDVTSAYYFECIPDYASALFVEGPPLCPIHYTWLQKSSRTARIK